MQENILNKSSCNITQICYSIYQHIDCIMCTTHLVWHTIDGTCISKELVLLCSSCSIPKFQSKIIRASNLGIEMDSKWIMSEQGQVNLLYTTKQRPTTNTLKPISKRIPKNMFKRIGKIDKSSGISISCDRRRIRI